MPWRPKKNGSHGDDQSNNENETGNKKKPRPQDEQEQDDDKQSKAGNNERKLKEEIQQIIRDELKQVINGQAEPQRERKTQVYGQKRTHVIKPMKIGNRSCQSSEEDQQGQKGQAQQQDQQQQQPKDLQVKHDIELLTQVQMEMAEELAANLKQLKEVIAESQQLAKRMQAVLGRGQGKQT